MRLVVAVMFETKWYKRGQGEALCVEAWSGIEMQLIRVTYV